MTYSVVGSQADSGNGGARRAVLGIDSGGSGTRWLLLSGGEVVATGTRAPLPRPPQGEAGLAAAVEALTAIASEARSRETPAAVVAGLAGLDEGNREALELEQAISATLTIPRGAVRVVNDMRIAYRAAFRPGEGILVHAGTGSIACCELSDGRLLRTGGHGYLIDDAGSGFWLGREALRVVLRHADENGSLAGTLAGELCRVLQAHDWPAIRAAVYGGGRATVASLAPAVKAAAEAGDDDAAGILAGAGRELARLAETLMRRIGEPKPVSFAGGVAKLGWLVVEPLRSALPPGTPLEVKALDPALAAARMAAELIDQ